jgi:hypothetical protein
MNSHRLETRRRDREELSVTIRSQILLLRTTGERLGRLDSLVLVGIDPLYIQYTSNAKVY